MLIASIGLEKDGVTFYVEEEHWGITSPEGDAADEIIDLHYSDDSDFVALAAKYKAERAWLDDVFCK